MANNIIFLALVAVVLFLKLFKQLGKVDGGNEERTKILNKYIEAQKSKVNGINKPIVLTRKESKIVTKDIEELKKLKDSYMEEAKKYKWLVQNLKVENCEEKDIPNSELAKTVINTFEKVNADPQNFMEGAEYAFEEILKAFSNNDHDVLKFLLSNKLYTEFKKQLDEAENKGESLNVVLVAMPFQKIVQARATSKFAFVDLEIHSQQIIFIENAQGQIIKGNKKDSSNIKELWSFKKEIGSKNPNWKIVGIQNVEA